MTARDPQVKGRPGPRRKQAFILVMTMALALALGAGFYLGQHAAYDGMGAKPKSYRAMQADLLVLRRALAERETELAIQGTRYEVDRYALELVRKDMAAQQEELAGLEEGLAFYRSLLTPGEIAPGLSLREIELVAGERPRHFLFRIVVQQEARKRDLLKGELNITVRGKLAGDAAEYSLAQLSDDVEAGGVPLAFRYFQSVEGGISLPEGFEPQELTVVAKTSGARRMEASQEFPWQLDERFTHVGK